MRVQIGNTGLKFVTIDPNNTCRTQKQYDAMVELHKLWPFKFWAINMFEPNANGKKYNCTFTHRFNSDPITWHSVRITPTGKLKEFQTIRLPKLAIGHAGRTLAIRC